jgi:hypothetical protein|nr:MAG TPA: hypothetical protein [Caudoviricetes sp.]
MKEQKPTNTELFVMITTLTEFVMSVIEENRQFYRIANKTPKTDEDIEQTVKLADLIQQTSKRAEQMSELILGTLNSVELEHKQSVEIR